MEFTVNDRLREYEEASLASRRARNADAVEKVQQMKDAAAAALAEHKEQWKTSAAERLAAHATVRHCLVCFLGSSC